MRKTTLGLTGDPDSAGGALHGYKYTWEPVSAGSLTMYDTEARHSGRPVLKYLAKYTEAGLCRRPYSRGLGRPSMREA